MPRVSTTIHHQLSKDEARSRIDGLIDAIRRDYADMVSQLQGNWNGDTLEVSFTAYGFDIASDVHVHPETVDVDAQIPLAALPFKGKIQRTIVGKLEEVLG